MALVDAWTAASRRSFAWLALLSVESPDSRLTFALREPIEGCAPPGGASLAPLYESILQWAAAGALDEPALEPEQVLQSLATDRDDRDRWELYVAIAQSQLRPIFELANLSPEAQSWAVAFWARASAFLFVASLTPREPEPLTITRSGVAPRPVWDARTAAALRPVWDAGAADVPATIDELSVHVFPHRTGIRPAPMPGAPAPSATPAAPRVVLGYGQEILPPGPPNDAARGADFPLRTAAPRAAPVAIAEPSLAADADVQFTVYRPNAVVPERWHDVLAFAHLSEKRPAAPEDEGDPIEEVQREAARLLGDASTDYEPLREESCQSLPLDSTVTFTLVLPGMQVNPPERSFMWREPVHSERFRIRAPAGLDGTRVRGHLSVHAGPLLLADVQLSIRVGAHGAGDTAAQPQAARRFRKIFASYSHRDAELVAQFAGWARAFGDQYLVDAMELRAGEVWTDALQRMIEGADVFQLFWSWNSIESPFVRREWELALSLGRAQFIRPIYWETPLPAIPEKELPPDALLRLQFHQLKSPTAGPDLVDQPHAPHLDTPLGTAKAAPAASEVFPSAPRKSALGRVAPVLSALSVLLLATWALRVRPDAASMLAPTAAAPAPTTLVEPGIPAAGTPAPTSVEPAPPVTAPTSARTPAKKAPAGGGTTNPKRSFDREAALRALGSAATAVRSCEPSGGNIDGTIDVTFENDGTAHAVHLDRSPSSGDSVGECVTKRFAAALVPPFDGPPVTMNFTLTKAPPSNNSL